MTTLSRPVPVFRVLVCALALCMARPFQVGRAEMALVEATRAPQPSSASPLSSPAEQWPQWRGPLGTGVSPSADPPIEWSEEKNVRWKLPLPGLGAGLTLVSWGDISVETAARNGGIQKVEHVDYELEVYLFVYRRTTAEVYGN